MKRQILLSQFGAALSALWIGCVPAALGQAIPRGGSLIVMQDPCSPCVSITGEQDASVINNFKQTLRLTVQPVQEVGLAVVTVQGSFSCSNVASEDQKVDFAAKIVRDNEPVDFSAGPGRVVLFAQLPPHGATTFNLASTRAFQVAAAGDVAPLPVQHDFHLRLARTGGQGPFTKCHVHDAALTIHYVRAAS